MLSVSRAEGLSGSWKEGTGVPSSSSSSGYWSWSAPSDQSNPSTPSPPLSADSFKPFRSPAPPDDGIDEAEASNLLFDEPIPRKRKVGVWGQDPDCVARAHLRMRGVGVSEPCPLVVDASGPVLLAAASWVQIENPKSCPRTDQRV